MSIIEVKNLTKKYGEKEAVKGITFNVEEGELFSFLGENGAGKSTTINILCGVLKKTSGEVTICGLDLDKDADAIKEQIGVVFQGSILDGCLSVYNNLKTKAAYYNLSKEEMKERIDYVVEVFNLEDILKQKYNTLSGGQRRRVDIARALLNRPKILFLDEPTTGLDPQTRVLVWNTLHKLRTEANLTIFLTTHYMEETALAHDVVVMDHGLIVAHDTPFNLKDKYTTDRIIWYINEAEENNKLLENEKLSYKYSNDAYIIKIKSTEDAAEFISNNKKVIKNFEVIKGNMDDVFLNITGRKLGE
ncbi:MAG: ABC transporter ATP-binding protein [bacterium]